MGLTRQERISLHTKQARSSIRDGVPSPADIPEGTSVVRNVNGILKEYTKHNGVLYAKVLARQ